MAIKTGREGMMTPRDEEIMKALFLCRYLATRQIATLFFNSRGAAGRRLWQLENKGYVTGRLVYTTPPTRNAAGKREGVWHLTKEAFDMIAHSLDLDEGPDAENYVPKQLADEKTRHHVKTNELFVAAKADLDSIVGDHPAWTWGHEKKVHDRYRYSGQIMGHQPDAHVRFFDRLFVIERQTRESRAKPKDIDDKVSGHATYERVRSEEPNGVRVIFACDDRRVADLAERAGERYGIDVVAGGVGEMAYHLYQSALRLEP